MKVRKKISEVMVISCEKIMPLPAILDKAYPCCPLDELEFQLSDNELSSFQEQYGFSYEDATNPDSNFYILEEAVDRFQDEQDCNLPENEVWENIIRNILSELAA